MEILQNSLVDKLKAIYDGESDRKVSDCKQSIEILEKALELKLIYNVDFNEAKETLSRSLQNALRKNLDLVSNSISQRLYLVDINSYVYLNQAKTQIKKIKEFLSVNKSLPEADETLLRKMLVSNEAGFEIFGILNQLKPNIVKSRKPAVIDPNAFRNKLGSEDAQKIVKDNLSDGIKIPLDQYENDMKNWFQSYIDKILNNSKGVYKRPKDTKLQNSMLDSIFFRCFDFEENYNLFDKDFIHYDNVKLLDNKKTYAADEAKKNRELIEQRYLIKNNKKLSNIIDLKNNILSIEELAYKAPTLNNGTRTIESGFIFKFNDNSKFTVINKIITKYTYSGKQFEQFPTTFHDVIMVDGSKMKNASEEKMVKEFTK